MANRTKMTPEAKEEFCRILAESYSNVTHTCEKMAISRTCAYANRYEDEGFRDAWDAAVTLGIEKLEDEAVARAVGGSDTLLIFMLKGAKPDKYRERRETLGTVAHTGAGGTLLPQAVVNVNITGSTPADPTEV